jgi:hypothetical protein
MPTPPLTDQQLISHLAETFQQAVAPPNWLPYVPAVSAASAAVAAFLSLISIWLNNHLARGARGYKLLPIIVFYRRSELIWTLKNVGDGTALKVSVRNYKNATQVQDEVELYPVGPGEEIRLDYLKGADKLVANYVNIFGQDPHHTVCSKNTNEMRARALSYKGATSFIKGHESDVEKWPITRL